MTRVLDDIDSLSGSTTSLVRTLIGVYMRQIGGWISIADLISLMEVLDVPAPLTRTAVMRLKKKEVLGAKTMGKTLGYELNPAAVPMLVRGDRRIYKYRQMNEDDAWCLVSYSIPEDRRDTRYQLRRRLQWIGCGNVSSALWICPDFLADEVEEILTELGVRNLATLFRTERPQPGSPLKDSVAQWWDLDMLSDLHRSFIRKHARDVELPPELVTPRDAFKSYIRSIDTWRILPYLDPGLPRGLLPDNWPGWESILIFQTISEKYRDLSHEYVDSILSRTSPQHLHLTSQQGAR